jgi:hypothetical protein
MSVRTAFGPVIGRYQAPPAHNPSPMGPALMARVAGVFKLPARLMAQLAAGNPYREGVPAGEQQAGTENRAKEAAAVRAYAMKVRALDPGFASDLLAAADRHERVENAAP